MHQRYEPSGSVSAFGRMAVELDGRSDVHGLLVLACDGNGWTREEVDPVLSGLRTPVFGGIFPQVIFDGLNRERGTLVVTLPVHPRIAVIGGLSGPARETETQVEAVADAWGAESADPYGTLLVFVDGLSSGIATLVQSLFFCFGLERNLVGGGAGSLSFRKAPCLITPEGLVEDGALLAHLPFRSGVGVAHGWTPVSHGMKVTEADRNVIRTLDWRPAFQVYRELVEAHSGRSFDDTPFFDLAKGYPFGINRLGAEVVVRDPLMVDDAQGLVCVGEVPTGSFVKLLHGTADSLIAAAGRATELAKASAPFNTESHHTALFIDCISRVLFLGDRMEQELAAAAAGRPLFGALTLGEIANSGRDYLEFYNKTAVLALLAES